MTLLLNVVGPSGIHLSSDYRLTDVATSRTIEDAMGSKQLRVSRGPWTAHISFTGIAELGGRKTRDWISQTISDTPQSAEITTVIAALAAAAMKELQSLPGSVRQLTIVVTVTDIGGAPRLFILSNIDRPGGPPLGHALNEVKVYEISSDKPRLLIFGFARAVTLTDRKLLKSLSRHMGDPRDIRVALSEINSRSAKRSDGYISEGCLVTTVLSDGSSAAENFGLIPGVALDIMGSTNIADEIARNFTPQPGRRPTLIQSRGARSAGGGNLTTAPMTVSEGNTVIVAVSSDSEPVFLTDSAGATLTQMLGPFRPGEPIKEIDPMSQEETEIGEPRAIAFSTPSASAVITAPDGSKLVSIMIGGVSGTIALRKNATVIAVLNTVSVEVEPGTKYVGQPRLLKLELPCVPTVDGIQPRSWAYTIDVHVETGMYFFRIHRNSIGFRSANYKSPMPLLADSEELAMTAPRNVLVLRVSADSHTVSANIEALFLLRDFPEPTRLTAPKRVPAAAAKVGRNSPCPCGSGKKYKKCCGSK